jgi:hypothetical protein
VASRNRLLTWAATLLAMTPLCLTACPPDQAQDIPNRVLDRPVDVALTCVHIECDEADECHAEPLSLRECRGEIGSCSSGGNHLVGFVSNSERNEVALFTQCAGDLVDMDLDAPGYNFVPVGTLPSAMVSSTDGCRAISANSGSCDLSVLDAPNLAGFGFDVRSPTRQTLQGVREPVEPSSLVSQIKPLRFDDELGWTPIAARPADIISVPKQLSRGSAGIAPQDPILDLCGPDQPGSVYVSFPSCNVIAEVDLVTHHVLQSFRFEITEDDLVEAIDMGESPVCPVDCPDAFDEGIPPNLPPADPQGLNPSALELVTPPFSAAGDCVGDGDPCTDVADCQVADSSLFVGGLGSDSLIEIPIDEDGRWDEDIRQLELVGAAGIERVRVSPVVVAETSAIDSSEYHSFIYVIAGDGSTRVIRRNLVGDPTLIGAECDTQVDPPFGEGSPVCYPVTQTPVGVVPPDRRSFALGPGIRAPGGGARMTDWAFKKVPEDTVGCLDQEPGVVPFGGPGGMAAIGTTNAGRVVFSSMGQLAQIQGLGDEKDPVGLLDIGVRWHMLLPEFSPVNSEGRIEPLVLPTVEDERSERRVPDSSGPLRVLSPGLRLIDWAYVYDPEVTGEDVNRLTLGAAYGGTDNGDGSNSIANIDRQGGPEALEDPNALGIYQNSVVRALARDYRAWGGSHWELVWEGEIPGARSTTGQFKCDQPGWEDATCLATDPWHSRLVDQGADFCSAGVLAGDKVVVLGCSDDSGCGAGQRCLTKPGGVPGGGLCISEQAFEADEQKLRQVCDHYISDPCGEPHREFLITRAFQSELWLQSLDKAPIAYLDRLEDEAETCIQLDDDELCFPPLVEREDQFVCTELQPENSCSTDEDCTDLLEGTDEDQGQEFLCIEESCRRACEDADECILRRLPGPACFREFVRYEIRARNAFTVEGEGPARFMSDKVFSDPDTIPPQAETQTPECVDGGVAAGVSNLLTSRIPLGPDEDSLDLPLCEPTDNVPDSGSPNPCLITQSRASDPVSRFHTFDYFATQVDGGEVTAVRYSNPIMSLVVDLTDLEALGISIPDSQREVFTDLVNEGGLWPAAFRRFRRSRIPRGYRETFNITPGYTPINAAVGIGSNFLTFPLRIVNAPDLNWTFIVDASGPGTSTSIRGQVLRVDAASNPPLADIGFDGVR